MSMIMLDRDGVLNWDRADYVKTPGELVLIDGAARAVARLNRAGVSVAVVTNQGINDAFSTGSQAQYPPQPNST